MTLNRFVFILFAALIVLSSCEKSNQFTIRGKITHAEGDTIYLEELHVSSLKPVGEVKVNKNGEFKFKGETGIPSYYLLKFSNTKFITLLIDSIENIVVEADFANFGRDYHVEGSPGSVQVRELAETLASTQHKLDSLQALNRLYQGSPDYETLKQKWNETYRDIVQKQYDFSKNFVMSNPFSMASVYALYQKYKDQSYVINDLQTMRTAASALNSIYPNSEHVKALYQNTLSVLKSEKAAKVQKFIQEQGENSPEIVLPNQDGKEIALSSLRGKVVLLHFWAAEDRGSRIINPVLVEVYKKYKNKGFEIYQVSVDTNRFEWVDAIDKDKLSWINVGDMKGSNNAATVYNVKEIPYNYLLDKEGAIIAKDLKGPALDKTLARILK
ncbi:MAG: AhpC/TSA family protein [Draconibacterium sp.]|nr:AhpC/TSA family protein [Draconibacterium sp.]